jgi:hypothetical protein
MDYTNNPEVNMQPAYANFKFLAELYGTLNGSPVPTDDALAMKSAVNNTNKAGGNRRRLIPSDVASALVEIDAIVDNGTYQSEAHGWRILHDNTFGHAYEIYISDGYSVQIHVLKA